MHHPRTGSEVLTGVFIKELDPQGLRNPRAALISGGYPRSPSGASCSPLALGSSASRKRLLCVESEAEKGPTAFVAILGKFQKTLGHLTCPSPPASSDGRMRKQNAQVELEMPSVLSDSGLGRVTAHGVGWLQPGRSSVQVWVTTSTTAPHI